MDDGRSIGTIDKIEKGKAIINYGLFTYRKLRTFGIC